MDFNPKNDITRLDKLKALNLDVNYTNEMLADNVLDDMYQQLITKKVLTDKRKKNNQNIKVGKGPKLAKDDPKYIATLKFLNALLNVMHKQPIVELTSFKNIRRPDILKDQCKAILDAQLEEIAKTFGKRTIHYDKRDKVATYILTLIRQIVTNCGYSFKSKVKFLKKGDNAESKYVHKSELLYKVF